MTDFVSILRPTLKNSMLTKKRAFDFNSMYGSEFVKVFIFL